jgi:two-component system, cell cycle sensor histidine kinase and response regulator CckA
VATTPLHVLFIEDSEDDMALQVRLLAQAGYEVACERVESQAMLTSALERRWDIIISDYSMPHFKGTDALKLVREKGLETPFLFVSGTIGEDTAVAALKVGAQDYLMKTNLGRLVPAVKRELREVEERKQRLRLEQQIHQLQRFEAIGRLAGGVAHDFNNMIGAIMGWADMGCEEAPPASRLRQRFEKIRLQAERAAGLTRQLLAFARRQVLQTRNTNLNDLTREEMSLLRNVIGEQIEVKLELQENVWVVLADPGQIEQVLMNLCLNARDAMHGRGTLTVETRNITVGEELQRQHPYASIGNYVLLQVTDTGDGMDATTMEHIFEPFFSTKEMGKGTGLGLATVYGIIKQHKGFVTVDTALGAGTTFRVYLPVGEGMVEAPSRERSVAICGGSETILVAEDNEGLREAVKEILESLGYKVVLTSDGEEALSVFREGPDSISLVLLDVVMPKLNGPEAYAQICALRPDIPVLFTTGYATETTLVRLPSKQKAAILQKPYGTTYLAQKIRELLDEKTN